MLCKSVCTDASAATSTHSRGILLSHWPPQLTASSVTGLLSHQPPQSPASSVTGLLSHQPPQSPASPLIDSCAVAASAVGADSYAQLLRSSRRWSIALGRLGWSTARLWGRGAPHRHQGTVIDLPILPIGRRKASGGQKGISPDGEGWDPPAVQQPMNTSSTHGLEAGQESAAVRRLQAAELGDGTGLLSAT